MGQQYEFSIIYCNDMHAHELKELTDMRVLVYGAGPVGLSTTLELASHGIRPELVEKRPGASEFSRAVGIIPLTIQNLRHEGVGEAILSEAVKWRKFAFYRGNRTLLDLDLSARISPKQCILGLPQDRTEGFIRDALAGLGISTKYGTEVVGVETIEDQARVSFADNRNEAYDWVVACDGVHSATREWLGIAYEGYDLEEEWSIADIDMSDDFDHERIRFWIQGDGGTIATCLPIEKHRARALSSTPDVLATIPVDLGVTNVRRAGTFRISVRQAPTYKVGRILFAGDAAHCHSPIGGRGMNLGIADAVAAARAIVEGTTETYSEERHAVGARVINSTEALRKRLASQQWLDRIFFDLALRAVQHAPFLHGALMKRIASL